MADGGGTQTPVIMAAALVCVAAVSGGGCAGGSADRALTAPERYSAPAEPPPTSAAGVNLLPVPEFVVRFCREAQETRSFAVLCPMRLPRASVGTPPGSPPPVLREPRTNAPGGPHASRFALHFTYSSPYEVEQWRNTPDRFLHFVVMGGDFPPERLAQPPFDPPAVDLGPRNWGGRLGRLYKAAPYSEGPSLHGNHFIFIWHQQGVRYAASLHSWRPKPAAAVLAALVANLGRVCGTRLCLDRDS